MNFKYSIYYFVSILSIIISGCSNNSSLLEADNIKLRERCDSLEGIISQLKLYLDTGVFFEDTKFYLVGNERDLIDQGIIERVSGISQEMKVNAENKYELLKRVKKYKSDTIFVKGKRIKVIGDFPKKSYKIKEGALEDEHYVIIIDKYNFWYGNNILIITYRQ